MPSNSLTSWNSTRSNELDELENAHARVGGPHRGRRFATQQINHAFAVLLSSQFQGFCRDLHSESVDHIVRHVTPNHLRSLLRAEFTSYRKLDHGNPNPGNIGADFNRLGIRFWDTINGLGRKFINARSHLEILNSWRNAIAHQDFDPASLGGTTVLHLQKVRQWRVACNTLAAGFDRIIGTHISQLTGNHPW